jgi:hypothetical protein
MAQKTRSQLKTQSNNTFLDNSAGEITPVNHRTWNDDAIDSVANLEDANTFENINTFDGDTTFNTATINGVSNFEATINANSDILNNAFNATGDSFFIKGILQLNNYSSNIMAAATVDLSIVSATVIYIEGATTINGFTGLANQIVNITFINDVLLEELGVAFFPSQSYQIYAGDSLIGIFTSPTQLRILTIKRRVADYYVLNSIATFRDLVVASALMGGQNYLVKGYNYPAGGGNPLNWEILFFATDSNSYDPNVRIRPQVGTAYSSNSKKFYDAQTTVTNGSIGSGDIILTGDTGSEYPISRFIADANQNEIFWGFGASAWGTGSSFQGFSGKIPFSQFGEPIYQNIQNLGNYSQPWFGKMLNSYYWSDVRFYPNSGYANQYWGNSIYENPVGLTIAQMNQLQVAEGNTGATIIATPQATYSVVNDMVTCYFSIEMSSPWNKGTSGREIWLYLPLPFTFALDNQCFGHGTVRNKTDNNQEDTAAMVENLGSNIVVRLSAKHNTAFGANKTCDVRCSFMYRTDAIYTPD